MGTHVGAVNTVTMVCGKRKFASPVFEEEPANKLRKTKTGQGLRMGSKELAMFKRSKPIIPLDWIPLEVLQRLLNFLDDLDAYFLEELPSLHNRVFHKNTFSKEN